ncbi:Phosphoglycerate dehydrogenase [Halobacillus dabanensis]|uniref:Phosphoglycerate dehydrogenase n=1 Tax=Halobacillus dabanensis TaxID=240302 RepID=A0A1I3XY52_HALDA|nr:D-2-hydroxyacid dehydrogenase [Halobacillus dabanensis]SFK24587.1 Phosphoglycerate dehydrogenase [Halobacillus dabanensis]
MKVVSAIKKVPGDIQMHLQTKFSDVTFVFCHGMGEAEYYLEEADVFITYGEDLDAEKIKAAKKLKWIMVLSAGMDRMPFEEISKRDILVTNVRGIHAQPMAEYAISMLLQVSRKAKTLLGQEQKEEWNRRPVMNEISGRTMVLLGTGAIPQEVARLAKAFHMKTIGLSKSGRTRPHFDKVYPVQQIDSVLAVADFIVAALPSTPDTKHMLTADQFKRMPKHSIFLNMGRGDLVSSEIILNAVRGGEIDHAVLDVFEEEPLPAGHPLWKEENITITPHISGISPQYIPRGFALFEENLEVFLSGEGTLKNIIDPKRGY